MQDQDDNLELDDDLLGEEYDDLALEDFDDDLLDDEAWDDLPSLDDDLKAGAPAASGAQPFNEKKKFSLNFNTVVIGGAVVIGLIVLSMQFLKSQKQANVGNSQRFISSLGIEGSTESLSGEDAGSDENANKEQQGGFLNDNMDILPEETHQIETDIDLPMPTPVSETGQNDFSIMDTLEFTTPASNKSINVGEMTGDQPQLDNDELTDDGLLNEITEQSPRAPDEDKTSFDVEFDLIEQVDTPVGAIDNEGDQKKEGAILNDSSSSTLNTLNNKMDVFIQRMDSLEDKIDTIDAEASQRTAMLEDTVEGLGKKIETIKSAPKVNTSTKKAVRKPVPKKVVWILKAAQPGKAWVSKRGDSAIKAVQVGDNIEGVGRITSIRLVNNRWVVGGSSGEIRQ